MKVNWHLSPLWLQFYGEYTLVSGWCAEHCVGVHLQWLIFCRGGAVLHVHHLSDLDQGEGDGDPGGAGEHPGRPGHVLLVLLVFGFPDGRRGNRPRRHRAAGGALALDQVDGGDGDRAGGNRDVLRQNPVLWRKKNKTVVYSFVVKILTEKTS